ATARACADRAGCPRCATELRLATADALAHVGRRSDASSSLLEWSRMQSRPQPRDRYLQQRVEALISDPPSSQLLEGAAREARAHGFGLDELWTRLDLGTTLATSDRAHAKDVLTATAQTASERGARTVRELAEKRLRALGVRTWRRGAGGGALT